MAISPAFTVSQSAITPAQFTVTDTSTGSDVLITSRRIYVQNAYGEYLTGDSNVDYDVWAYAQSSITLDVLTQDTAANIRVDWMSAGGTVLYTLNNNYPLSQFGKQFAYYIVNNLGLTPGVYQDATFSGNLALLWTYIVAGDNAVTYGNDIAGAQACYNLEIEMQNNESMFF